MTFSRAQANLGQNITDARATVAAFREDIKVRRKRLFAPFYILKMMILPRQARDKHRESSTQKGRGDGYSDDEGGLPAVEDVLRCQRIVR
eukprot:COSAG06_NODE_40780_length_398_cov_1.722408_1_plen_90_part_00